MKTFRTPKGTELPMMNLKSKDYLEVKWRIVWFREDHPDWSIETDLVEVNEKYAIARGTVKDQVGRVIAMGHKREDAVHFQDYIEKCETSAIGRALALCGYGTQFADELEEGERIVDSPVMAKPVIAASPKAQALNTKVAAKAGPKFDRKALNEEIMMLYPAFVEFFGQPTLNEYMTEHFGTTEANKLTDEQLNQLAAWMRDNPKAHTSAPQAANHNHTPVAGGQGVPLEEAHTLPQTVIGVKVFHNRKNLQGKTFQEVGKEALSEAAKTTHEWFMREKKPISATWQDFFEKAERFCFAEQA